VTHGLIKCLPYINALAPAERLFISKKGKDQLSSLLDVDSYCTVFTVKYCLNKFLTHLWVPDKCQPL
jgi:hypothetical protein